MCKLLRQFPSSHKMGKRQKHKLARSFYYSFIATLNKSSLRLPLELIFGLVCMVYLVALTTTKLYTSSVWESTTQSRIKDGGGGQKPKAFLSC